MDKVETFQAFFSYSHHDAQFDPELVAHFSTKLEGIVTSRLAKDQFRVWRDINQIRGGDDWNEQLQSAVRSSQFLIVLLTPKWMGSRVCRREYLTFRELESNVPVGTYVVPIVAREMKDEVAKFDHEDAAVFDDLQRRHYRKNLATNFRSLTADERILRVEEIADDIYHMIRQRTEIARRAATGRLHRRPSLRPMVPRKLSSTHRPHRFPDTDFMRGREVLVDKHDSGNGRRVCAQADFFERLYVEAGDADNRVQIEFGVYRAKLTLTNEGSGRVKRSPNLEGGDRNTYYANPDAEPKTHTVFADASTERPTLGEGAFDPTEGENRYAEIALLSPEVGVKALNAQIEVSFCSEGLSFLGEDAHRPSPELSDKIAAIIMQLAKKDLTIGDGRQAVRSIPVTERDA
jgi:hypothetical protein